MTKAKIICIPGLAADHRLFVEQSEYFNEDLHCLALNRPDGETLTQYATQLGESLSDENNILVGVSFGAQLALEIARSYPEKVKKVFVISSHPHSDIYTATFTLQTKVLQLLPNWFVKSFFILSSPVFALLDGLSLKHTKKIIAMAVSCDMDFFRWAVNACTKWSFTAEDLKSLQDKVVRIHGEKDWVIPVEGKVDHLITGGTHLIVYKNADQINTIINTHP